MQTARERRSALFAVARMNEAKCVAGGCPGPTPGSVVNPNALYRDSRISLRSSGLRGMGDAIFFRRPREPKRSPNFDVTGRELAAGHGVFAGFSCLIRESVGVSISIDGADSACAVSGGSP
jgi:hypothetical protein